MDYNFEQIRAAAHDDLTAKILRSRWGLDERNSASGSVVCDRADIERMLMNGQLEPVLSVDQFVRISQGKAYGTAGTTSPAQSTTHAAPLGATEGINWAHHPDWAEFQSLSEPMKAAVRHDFTNFLFVKRRSGIASLSEIVGGRVESEARERSRASDRRTQEAALEAPLTEAAIDWVRGRKNYPGLQKKAVR